MFQLLVQQNQRFLSKTKSYVSSPLKCDFKRSKHGLQNF